LFAVEPEGFGVVSDCKVPLRDFSLRGEDLDPARIETVSNSVARVSKGRLRDGVVSRDSREFEGDDRTIRGINTGGDELENSSWGSGSSTNLHSDLSSGSSGQRQGGEGSQQHYFFFPSK